MIDLSQEACDRRLRDALTFVTANAEEAWDQNVWGLTETDRDHFIPEESHCGTKACVAGWAAIHAGLARPSELPVPGFLDEPHEAPHYCLEITQTGQDLIFAAELQRYERAYDPSQDFFALGAVLFGLGCREYAVALLRANHTLGSLWSMAAQLTKGRITLPEELRRRVVQVDVSRYEKKGRIFQFDRPPR